MRYASIDVLRTLAISLMVLVHFMENLSGSDWWPGGLAAPLFTFLVGVSFRLWVQSQEAKNTSASDITRIAVRRGLFLFVLGIAFNFFIWLPEDTFNWDVLTLIGTATMILALVRGMPVGFLTFVCVVIFVLSPFLRIQADFADSWTNGYYEHDETIPDILVGFLAVAYFPVFPWLVFPLAGYIAGAQLFPEQPENGTTDPPSVRPLVLLGAGLILLSVVLVCVRSILPDPVPDTLLTGWTMFPASVEYVTGMLGFVLLSLAGLHVWLDRRQLLAHYPGVVRVAETMSRYSLTIYVLHHAVHLWPLWIYGAVVGEEPTQFWHNALPVEVSVVLAIVCLVVCYFLFRWMSRVEWPCIESIMRWVCD
jgi:uncharacterized membrane protein